MVDARPCPFCGHPEPRVTITTAAQEHRYEGVSCPECGAVGPRALPEDPPGQALFMWNLRFGGDHESCDAASRVALVSGTAGPVV